MNCDEKERSLFARWYQGLKDGELRKLYRTAIVHKCRINENIFYNWLNGRSEIPQLAKPMIERIIGVAVFTKNTENYGGN